MTAAHPSSLLPFERLNAEIALRVLLLASQQIEGRTLAEFIHKECPKWEVTGVETMDDALALIDARPMDVMIILAPSLFPHIQANFPTALDMPRVWILDESEVSRALVAGTSEEAYLFKDSGSVFLKLLPLTVERVAHHHRTRALFRDSDRFCRQLFDETPFGQMIVSFDGTVIQANRFACELLGYEKPELLAGGLGHVLSPEDLANLCISVRAIANSPGQPCPRERATRHRTGRMLRVEFHLSLIRRHDDSPASCMIHLLDVSEARQIEGRLRANEARVQGFLDANRLKRLSSRDGAPEAELSQLTKREAIRRSFAHDFNNLLTSIMGNLQLSEMDIPSGHPAQPFIAQSLEASLRARDLVRRVLSTAHDPQG